jgi:hypothetical protein
VQGRGKLARETNAVAGWIRPYRTAVSKNNSEASAALNRDSGHRIAMKKAGAIGERNPDSVAVTALWQSLARA